VSLRLRLIVVFFLLSVVPVGAVTYYTYAANAEAMRDAARIEAELLAAELSGRMASVTAQLGKGVEELMEMPEAPERAERRERPEKPEPPERPEAVAATPGVPPAGTVAVVGMPDGATTVDLHKTLGELAELVKNIEVRGVRPRWRLPDGTIVGPPGGGPPGVPPSGSAATDDRPARPEGFRGRRGGPDGGPPPGTPGGPAPGTFAEPPADPNRIRIDLREMRRKLFEELVQDREAFDKLPPEERQKVFATIDQRMADVAQGVAALQKALEARALDAQAKVDASTPPPAGPSEVGATPPAPPATQPAETAATPPRPPTAPKPDAAPRTASKPAAAPASPAVPPAPAPSKTDARAMPMKRSTSLSGRQLAVKMERGGQVVGQVSAEIDMPRLLTTVFAATSRDRGDLPFAIGEGGEVFTATPIDKSRLEALPRAAIRGGTSGATVLPDWIVATTPAPGGSPLTFGIARPVGEALHDLRTSSARNAALGLGFIGLALIAIVPLAGRLTRNLETLSTGVRRIAEGDYAARVPVRSNDEIGRLAVAFNRMAADVEAHQRSAVSQERIRRELELGRQIQHDMLPRAPLQAGLTEIKGVSVPAREVGGDFFNYFTLRDGTIALLVGDVSGKGVGAALLMANLQGALRTRLSLGQDLASLAKELDVEIERTTPGPVYATLFVGILDATARHLRFVNAGHNPQYVLRTDGRLERMESTGRPIGLLSGGGYVMQQVDMTAGDVLFFYTDGCVEAEDAAGDMFGSERLERALAKSAGLGADQVMVAVEAEISAFRSGVELTDDATMMVVKVG